MADTYYVWSPIRHGTAEGLLVTFNVGDKVTEKDIGDDFDYFVESGIIRTIKYPNIPEGYGGSPAQWMREKYAKIAEENDVPVDALEEVSQVVS